MVEQFYSGKSILITGCTGFVGKVLLEKILFSLPQVAKIYVFVRPKKGSNIYERFQKEIIESACLDRVKRKYPNFETVILPKLVPISGDMLKKNLDLSAEDYEELRQNTNIIINSAASIDFNQRLDQALQINALGTLRVVELAKSCKRLEAFVQISTAYVNCDKDGWIQEKIYPYGDNPKEVLKTLLAIPVEMIEGQTAKIIGKYPNTYTYTKHLTEQLLITEAEGLPICIVRPTIIGGSWKEPYPGWVDSVSAAGVFYLSIGLGLLKISLGKQDNIGDQIPVDCVVNCVIVAAALACGKQEKMPIIHIGTSARNPVTWRTCNGIISGFWNRYPSEKAMARCSFTLTDSVFIYKTLRFFKRQLPTMIVNTAAKVSGVPSLIKKSHQIQKLLRREVMISESFSHFTMHEWIFESQQAIDLHKHMSPYEQQIFGLDISDLDWRIYLTNYAQGLKKYILKEKVESSDEPNAMDILSDYKHYSYFSDIKWAYNSGKVTKSRGIKEMRSIILNSQRVKKVIQEITADGPNSISLKEANVKAQEITSFMLSDLKMPVVRMFAWSLRKLWRAIYEKVVVDNVQLIELSKVINQSEVPIVIIPSHRSYIDFLIVSYLFFAFGVKVPHIAAADDFLQILFVNKLFRHSGAFFIKRGKGKDPLYQAILMEYMQQLLKDQQLIEFFIEGTRSRSGKTLPPKQGLLSMCTETYYSGTVSDIKFLPITINYERVLEGETFPLELLGEEKVRESLTRIIKAVKILNMNFGKIHIVLGDLVSLKQFSKDASLNPIENLEHRKEVNFRLGQEITLRLQETHVIMASTLVAAVLLMHRRGVSEDELIIKVEWLRDETKLRGFKVGGIDGGSASIAVRNALNHLDSVIRHKKDLFEPSVSMKADYQNILMLSYYRNSLHFIFALEAIIACALFSFGEKLAWGQGVPKKRFFEKISFLCELLENEFYLRVSIKNVEYQEKTLKVMIDRKILEETDGAYRILRNGETAITFFCSLVWPLLDTYWIVLNFCTALRFRDPFPYRKLIQSIQWFGESLFEDRSLLYYESCSQENIKNCLQNYEKLKILQKENKGITFTQEYLHDENKVQELLEHITNFRKISLVKMVNQHDNLKRALIPEFPELPKL